MTLRSFRPILGALRSLQSVDSLKLLSLGVGCLSSNGKGSPDAVAKRRKIYEGSVQHSIRERVRRKEKKKWREEGKKSCARSWCSLVVGSKSVRDWGIERWCPVVQIHIPTRTHRRACTQRISRMCSYSCLSWANGVCPAAAIDPSHLIIMRSVDGKVTRAFPSELGKEIRM